MAMDPDGLKSKIKQTVFNGLKEQFGASASKGKGYNSEAEQQWQKMAEAISGIAADIVMEITNNAEVQPGISISGIANTIGGPSSQTGPVSGSTSSPGKIT